MPVGLPALPPSQPNLVMNPLMANVLGGLSAEDVPFQEGWLKLRGIPFSVTKTDIIAFFAARSPTHCTASLSVAARILNFGALRIADTESTLMRPLSRRGFKLCEHAPQEA